MTDHSIVDHLHSALSSGHDKPAMAEAVARLITSELGHRWAGIYEVGEHEIFALGWAGPHAPAHPSFPKSRGLCGRAVDTRSVVRVDDVTKDPRYLTTLDSTRAELVVPVTTEDTRIVGLIDVASDEVGAFSDDDVAVLESCAAAIRPLWARPAVP